jgi:hypothetical protein
MFTLVVEAPASSGSARVAGYAFRDIAELGLHALLMLSWLHELPRSAGDDAAAA